MTAHTEHLGGRAGTWTVEGEIGRWSIVEEQVRILQEETTELGLTAQDIFQNAVSALFGQAVQAGLSAMEAQRQCAQAYSQIHQRALNVLMHFAPTPEDMRRVVSLQNTALEFTRIAELARGIAEHAISLAGAADSELNAVSEDASDQLWCIVRQAYIEVRGAIIVCNTQNTVQARRLAAEDSELDRLYLTLKSLLERAIAAAPQAAYPLHQVLLIGSRLEEIGNRAAVICRAVL